MGSSLGVREGRNEEEHRERGAEVENERLKDGWMEVGR